MRDHASGQANTLSRQAAQEASDFRLVVVPVRRNKEHSIAAARQARHFRRVVPGGGIDEDLIKPLAKLPEHAGKERMASDGRQGCSPLVRTVRLACPESRAPAAETLAGKDLAEARHRRQAEPRGDGRLRDTPIDHGHASAACRQNDGEIQHGRCRAGTSAPPVNSNTAGVVAHDST